MQHMKAENNSNQTQPSYHAGSSTNRLLDHVREMVCNTLQSVWLLTSELPDEISSKIKETGCLCITLPEHWEGDVERLAQGPHEVVNRFLGDSKICDTYMVVGGSQVELNCWILQFLKSLRSQFPVLFLRGDDWHLVVYPWDTSEDLRVLNLALAVSFPTFRTEEYYDEHAKERRLDARDRSPRFPSRPVNYRHQSELRGWEKWHEDEVK
ncbi:hypothetical protein WQE_08492 [Paraburkholderia hospita]|uniref:Uncharacterized protein n=1 Tax=Paraburkholderia hospita TaxID=169430 RepID=A0ABN0FRX5_9BURK|nr:hypothetical protein [Paraburkholderia hospita]EIN01530.1 hypothetical protein WQE_08492 [Paraburkholderia hospita]OUL83634.1 hypothetical protein CA602_21690 [Paraburkholderia hospita]